MFASSFWCVCFLQITDTDEQTRYTTDTADHTSPHQAHLVPRAQTRSLRVPAVRRHSALNPRHVSNSGLKAATSCTRPNPSTISGLSASPLPPSRLAASAATGGGGLADWLQASIAWRGLPDNFQRLAHQEVALPAASLLLHLFTPVNLLSASLQLSDQRPSSFVCCCSLDTKKLENQKKPVPSSTRSLKAPSKSSPYAITTTTAAALALTAQRAYLEYRAILPEPCD